MAGSQAGDLSFEEAFDRLHKVARVTALRIVDRDLAEDLAAEAMARVFAHWRRLRDVSYQEAWVVRVTTNLALNTRRRRPPVVVPSEGVRSTEDVVVLQQSLVDAIRRLPRRQREVVALSYLADMSESDVASLLSISPGAVKSHLHRGLAALRGGLGVDVEEIRPCLP
jgi:RNA polymerase sigma-70 factor (ECF subfamily)